MNYFGKRYFFSFYIVPDNRRLLCVQNQGSAVICFSNAAWTNENGNLPPQTCVALNLSLNARKLH